MDWTEKLFCPQAPNHSTLQQLQSPFPIPRTPANPGTWKATFKETKQNKSGETEGYGTRHSAQPTWSTGQSVSHDIVHAPNMPYLQIVWLQK